MKHHTQSEKIAQVDEQTLVVGISTSVKHRLQKESPQSVKGKGGDLRSKYYPALTEER